VLGISRSRVDLSSMINSVVSSVKVALLEAIIEFVKYEDRERCEKIYSLPLNNEILGEVPTPEAPTSYTEAPRSVVTLDLLIEESRFKAAVVIGLTLIL